MQSRDKKQIHDQQGRVTIGTNLGASVGLLKDSLDGSIQAGKQRSHLSSLEMSHDIELVNQYNETFFKRKRVTESLGFIEEGKYFTYPDTEFFA